MKLQDDRKLSDYLQHEAMKARGTDHEYFTLLAQRAEELEVALTKTAKLRAHAEAMARAVDWNSSYLQKQAAAAYRKDFPLEAGPSTQGT